MPQQALGRHLALKEIDRLFLRELEQGRDASYGDACRRAAGIMSLRGGHKKLPRGASKTRRRKD